MYLELLATATATQQDLATAYTQTGRLAEVGQYFRALNIATTLFFEQVEPPAALSEVHAAFLNWQKLGQEALAEEIAAGEPVDNDTTRRYVEANQEFAQAMAAFVEAAQAA
ncbi:MAG TPA: hypothetical protein P5526_20930 [Anaerolineae bacterium]|nr:hypothetical protein [Anaerolineae bacterium]MCB9105669.1 hypothetical protein [Anaerolineales bacterium]HRV94636.1 hypothetical protein [Anaerolineae bacterium]